MAGAVKDNCDDDLLAKGDQRDARGALLRGGVTGVR
jgi:hypothetical protein